ncbi:YolD-like family protein [Paenibacillus sepulcri]|uniref:YolD-like family protein n=1 Tax=Paenibacillus sepulcri TaxID=359917 RepID=A0ABS7C6U9_9BACL|nr:YolD-like family protein [Paenibacillus sepulcri]
MAKAPKRPTRDEFQLEELGERLTEAKQEDSELLLTVWGWENKVQGRIVLMDARTRLVHMENLGEITKVPFLDIMNVENAS